MSRLLHPGTGEIVDRLAILSLKLLHADAPHFATEREGLIARLAERPAGACIPCVIDLVAVNALLWQAEDDLRGLAERNDDPETWEPTDWEQAATTGFAIQALNDRRNGLIGEINRLTGEWVGEEKIR